MSAARRITAVWGLVLLAILAALAPQAAGTPLGPAPVHAAQPDKQPPGKGKHQPSPTPKATPQPTPRATPKSTPKATPRATARPAATAVPRATAHPAATPEPRATPRPTPRPVAAPAQVAVVPSASTAAVTADGSVDASAAGSSGTPLMGIGIALAALIAVGGGLFMVARRSRRDEPPAVVLIPIASGMPTDLTIGDPLLQALGGSTPAVDHASEGDQHVPLWVRRLEPELRMLPPVRGEVIDPEPSVLPEAEPTSLPKPRPARRVAS